MLQCALRRGELADAMFETLLECKKLVKGMTQKVEAEGMIDATIKVSGLSVGGKDKGRYVLFSVRADAPSLLTIERRRELVKSINNNWKLEIKAKKKKKKEEHNNNFTLVEEIKKVGELVQSYIVQGQDDGESEDTLLARDDDALALINKNFQKHVLQVLNEKLSILHGAPRRYATVAGRLDYNQYSGSSTTVGEASDSDRPPYRGLDLHEHELKDETADVKPVRKDETADDKLVEGDKNGKGGAQNDGEKPPTQSFDDSNQGDADPEPEAEPNVGLPATPEPKPESGATELQSKATGPNSKKNKGDPKQDSEGAAGKRKKQCKLCMYPQLKPNALKKMSGDKTKQMCPLLMDPRAPGCLEMSADSDAELYTDANLIKLMTSSMNWCFTYNNPTVDPSALFKPKVMKYFVAQLEVGDSGTPHIQGYLRMLKKVRMIAMKELIPEAHWEVRKGSHDQARSDCMKSDTRVPNTVPFESGEQPASGKRNDIQEFKDSVKQGTPFDQLVEDHSEIAMKYPSFIEQSIKGELPQSIERELTPSPTEPVTKKLKSCEYLTEKELADVLASDKRTFYSCDDCKFDVCSVCWKAQDEDKKQMFVNDAVHKHKLLRTVSWLLQPEQARTPP
eukprot:SAG11_NODE_457_length_9306_cov_2.887803_5_plen_622_part_00